MTIPSDISAVLNGESEGCIVTGDCLEIMKDMPDGCVDAVVTDPPYFQPATHYCPTRDEGRVRKSIGDMSILELGFRYWTESFVRVAKQEAHLYLFCDGQSYPLAFTALYPHCTHVRPIVWDKVVSYNGYTWRHQHELIAWGEQPKSFRVPTGDGDILRCRAVPVKERMHPAEKPLALVTLLVKKHEANIILDPFCGSGTTCVAAKKLGRRWIGIEIDPGYAETARNRLRDTERNLFTKET